MERRVANRRASERGVALLVALMLLLLISTLTASIIVIANSETWTAANYRTLMQSRYAAEAGAQRALNWLTFSYPQPSSFASFDMTGSPVLYNGNPVVLSAIAGTAGNYPTASVQTAFQAALQGVALPGLPTATSSVTATLIRLQQNNTVYSAMPQTIQTWRIVSVGSVAGVRPASVQVEMTVERGTSQTPGYALYATSAGCEAITMTGQSFTDSFDSSQGSYAATHQNSGGDVGTNGNVDMSGASTKIWGTLYSPHAGTGNCSAGSPALTGSSANVSGGQIQLGAAQTFTVAAPSPTPPTTNLAINSTPYPLAPGTYGNVSAQGNRTIILSAGTYNVNSITLGGSSSIQVASGPVIINVEGAGVSKAIDFGGATTENQSGIPSNLQINYAGSGDIVISSGGSQAFLVLNAPNADVTVSGGSDLYGSIIGSTITLTGGTSVHYDRSMSSGAGAAIPFRSLGFSWSKF